MSQVYGLRHQQQEQLETLLGCRLGATVPDQALGEELAASFNTVCVPFPWSDIEPTEGDFRWQTADAQVTWALARGLKVIGGPVVDFFGVHLPTWLTRRRRDLSSLCGCLCDYVESCVARYRGRIRAWQVSAGSNSSQVLAMSDEELLWLTLRLAEAARQSDPALEIILSIDQPFGEYLVLQQRTHSPFLFADTLIRSGLKVAALNLEVIMAVSPRGTYCRDILDVSRLLDMYTLLGVPLQVTLGYPSSSGPDRQADADLEVNGGACHGGFSPEAQAAWAEAYAGLALCKPSVRSCFWTHLGDADPHLFPHCGLVDLSGKIKPAIGRLRQLREQHLK